MKKFKTMESFSSPNNHIKEPHSDVILEDKVYYLIIQDGRLHKIPEDKSSSEVILNVAQNTTDISGCFYKDELYLATSDGLSTSVFNLDSRYKKAFLNVSNSGNILLRKLKEDLCFYYVVGAKIYCRKHSEDFEIEHLVATEYHECELIAIDEGKIYTRALLEYKDNHIYVNVDDRIEDFVLEVQ